MGGAVGGVEFVSAEQKELNDIEKTAERESRSLSAQDAATQSAVNILNQTENSVDSLREELDILEPTDPRAQNLRLRISEEQKKAEALKVAIGEKKEEGVQQVTRHQERLYQRREGDASRRGEHRGRINSYWRSASII